MSSINKRSTRLVATFKKNNGVRKKFQVFACLGFLSPANRGALMTCAMVLFVCLGTPAGYVSARVYKSFGGEKWKSNVLLTSMFCPG